MTSKSSKPAGVACTIVGAPRGTGVAVVRREALTVRARIES